MIRRFIVLLFLFMLVATGIRAQSDEPPPYLYYYSWMLGGLIIERADGTDSRQIAADVLPPDPRRTGLDGPGWSPSGRYFAAYGVEYRTYSASLHGPVVFDAHGIPAVDWMNLISNTIAMRWSPGDEDILLILGGYRRELPGLGSFIWLVDVPNNQLLAEFGINLDRELPGLGEIVWDIPNEQVVIDVGPDMYWKDGRESRNRYFRVTLHFDGITVKQPVDLDEFRQTPLIFADPDIYRKPRYSPSGIYEVFSRTLTNTSTGAVVTLPRHSQATICGDYVWTPDERYLITLNGTLQAGGGCARAVLGVTDNKGVLWRELGYCSWDAPPCIGWLPDQIDISSLPPGADRPVQLDPVRIEPIEGKESIDSPNMPLLHCGENKTATITDATTHETLYSLVNFACPYDLSNLYDAQSVLSRGGLPIVVAYSPEHDLLATYYSYFSTPVVIWLRRGHEYTPVLPLNTDGYALEFSAEGNYLKGWNIHAWKVYAVTDILAAVSSAEQS